jgi:hypothetical protein
LLFFYRKGRRGAARKERKGKTNVTLQIIPITQRTRRAGINGLFYFRGCGAIKVYPGALTGLENGSKVFYTVGRVGTQVLFPYYG